MACRENICCGCGHAWFTNGECGDCVKCGGSEITTHFDEPMEVEDIRDHREVVDFRERAAGITEEVIS